VERGRPEPLLVASGVSCGYGAAPVVREVSVAVGRGEIVAVIGPNGAGKSTLLKGLVGNLRVSSGSVVLGGEDVTGRPPEEVVRRGLGYVPQVGDIFGPLTVAENLEMGGYLLAAGDLPRRREEVCEVFPALGPMLRRRADKLSGGERKMLAIARVLMLDPPVMVLDEPTANLAPRLADALLRGQVRRLADLGKAVLLVEQRARAAMEVADWAMVMVSGTTRLEGPPAELMARPDFEELFLGGAGSAATPSREEVK
jgi:ABC-type branched-subunit amino acid transport system ATPase component